jgi:hypothetical protein
MKSTHMTPYLVSFIFSTFFSTSCESPRSKQKAEIDPIHTTEVVPATKPEKTANKNVITTEVISPTPIHSFKFFFENSGSMNGYISEHHDFKTAISRILSDANYNSFNAYLINTALYKFNVTPDKVHSSLTAAGIKKGSTHTSDLNFILKTVLDSTSHQDVSMLVTDGLYSVEGDPKSVLGKLQAASNFTAKHFENRLRKEKKLQTVLIKLSSQFKGQYYPVQGKGIAIDQKRPYYIWLFGSAGSIASIQKELNFSDLPGYQQHIVFNTTANKKVDYYIVPGFMNKGTFRQHQDPKLRHNHIKDIDKDRRSKDFQFAVGVDLSSLPVQKKYLLDISNYEILENTDYTIKEIHEVKSLTPAQIIKLKNPKTSHIIVLHTSKSPYGNLKLALKKQLPAWIKQTHSLNDTNIKGDEKTTLGFNHLVGAIDRAYTKVSNTQHYINLPLNIQQ